MSEGCFHLQQAADLLPPTVQSHKNTVILPASVITSVPTDMTGKLQLPRLFLLFSKYRQKVDIIFNCSFCMMLTSNFHLQLFSVLLSTICHYSSIWLTVFSDFPRLTLTLNLSTLAAVSVLVSPVCMRTSSLTKDANIRLKFSFSKQGQGCQHNNNVFQSVRIHQRCE